MHTHHVVPICRSHYAVIHKLIMSGHLRHDPAAKLQHDQPTGLIYQPIRRVSLDALSDTTVQIGAVHIPADLWRLPTAEYNAIQGQSFQANLTVQAIKNALRANVGSEDFRALLDNPLQGTPAYAGESEPHIQATWCREEWAVMQIGNHWFLVLWFNLARTTAVQGIHDQDAALDVGRDPVVHVVWATRFSWSVWDTLPTHISALRIALNHPKKQLLDRSLFEHHRTSLLALAETLVREASAVYVEDLTYREMHRPFVQHARRTGLLDWHESWLHTRLRLAGVRFERVDPTGTSQRCSRCDGHPYGQRRASLFICRVCGPIDAHENAARNILRLGRQKVAQRDLSHPVKGPGGRS